MKAMILAAGLGTRLRPLTEKIPKPLIPLAGKPLIVWNLLLLRQHGIKDVMINLHYLGQLIEQELGDGSQWGLCIRYSPEPVLLGTGGGIKNVESFFEGESLLILNGDTVIDLDLTKVMAEHSARGGVATMVLREDPEVDRWGVVETTADHRVVRINGRGRTSPPLESQLLRYMFAGVHIVDYRVLRHCPSGQPSSIIDGYVAELEQNSVVHGHLTTGYWSDIGTLERYTQAQGDFDAGRIDLLSRLV